MPFNEIDKIKFFFKKFSIFIREIEVISDHDDIFSIIIFLIDNKIKFTVSRFVLQSNNEYDKSIPLIDFRLYFSSETNNKIVYLFSRYIQKYNYYDFRELVIASYFIADIKRFVNNANLDNLVVVNPNFLIYNLLRNNNIHTKHYLSKASHILKSIDIQFMGTHDQNSKYNRGDDEKFFFWE